MASRELLSELLPTTPLVLGVMGYNLATFWAEGFIQRRVPRLYSHLKENHRALLYYSAFVVGKVLAVVFVPACTLAAIQGKGSAAAVMGETPWQATTVEKVCVTSRIAIWMGELPRTQLNAGLVAHHTWSVVSMLLILGAGHPPQQLYVMYAALLTETFSKVSTKFRIIKKNNADGPLKKLADDNPLQKVAAWANLLGLVALRAPSVIYSLYVVLQIPYRNALVWLNVGGMAYYLVYIFYLTYTSASRMGLVRVSSGPPKHILIFNCFAVSRGSCLVGLARVATCVLSVILYFVVSKQGPQHSDTDLQRGVALVATAAILLGRIQIMPEIWPLKARQVGSRKSPKVLDAEADDRTEEGRGVASGHSSDTLIDSSDSEDERNMVVVGRTATGTQAIAVSPGQSYALRGSWLQCALELAVSILVASYWGLPIQIDSKLGASVMLALPLTEVIAPLDRHYVSEPSTSAGKARMPAGFSVVLFGALVALTVYGITDMLQAAVFSVTLHGAFQVLLDYQALNLSTKGARRWSLCMQVFAAIRSSLTQTSLALICLATMEWERGYLSAYLTTCPALVVGIGASLLFLVVAWSSNACRPVFRLLGAVVSLAIQPMVYSSVIGLYICGLTLQIVIQGVVPLKDRMAKGRNPLEQVLDSMLHWRVVVCMVGVLLIPVVGSVRSAATVQTKPISLPKNAAAIEDQLDQKQAEKSGKLAESIHDKVL